MHLIVNEGGNHHQEAGQVEDCILQQQQHAMLVIEFTFSPEHINDRISEHFQIPKSIWNLQNENEGKTIIS